MRLWAPFALLMLAGACAVVWAFGVWGLLAVAMLAFLACADV